MNSKRILSLVMAMVLAVSLCLPGTTAYAIEPEDDDLESEQVIPTEPALCSYTSNENDRHADIVERIRDTKRHLSCMIEIRRIWMFTQDFYLMTIRIKVPDHPAFAMKTEKWGIPNGRI